MTAESSRRSSRRRRPALEVRVTDGLGRPAPLGRGLAVWLARSAPAGTRGQVTLALVSDSAIRRLNREFRGQDVPTDVLSFPTDGAEGTGQGGRPASRAAAARAVPPGVRGPRSGRYLGDIAIAVGVARRQARQLGHPLAAELRILALHGLLHLLGYDHEADRGEMGRLEDRLRRRAGLPSALIARSSRLPAHR